MGSWLISALLFLYMRRVAKQKATDTRFKDLEAAVEKIATSTKQATTSNDLKKLENRIAAGCLAHKERTGMIEMQTAKLKIELEHLPTQRQFNELNKSITALNGELQKTVGRLEGINRVADLMNEFLINQGGGVKK